MDPDSDESDDSQLIDDDDVVSSHSNDSSDGQNAFADMDEIVGNVQVSSDAKAFDINVAGRHEYLGNNLDAVSGFTFYEENSVQKIPVMKHQTVSFPGQKMPFNLIHQSLIAMVMSVMEGDKTFGLVADLDHYNESVKGCIGVTFQVMNCSPVVQGRCKLTGMCRQRFKIIEATKINEHVLNATVMILSDKLIVPFYASMVSNSRDRTKCSSRRKLNASIRTPWPTFVYEQYSADKLVESIHAQLMELCHGREEQTKAPLDPLTLSYWVAQNLPLVDQQRTFLLNLDCPVQRLRWELHFMAKCSRICCCTCGMEVSNTSSVFSMNTDGPQGAYVNPDGYMHDTLTVHSAANLLTRDLPTDRFSWFPGYKWVCVYCHSCLAHIGWRFDSAGDCLPPCFWGLTRKALITMPGHDVDIESGSELRPII
ncbi:protein cereblon [Cloeon dipterum]|uniref:protein cereblon n=1 Tax=Cloeon dipterum TaxID=197152 RepID=UPI00322096F3